MATGGGLRHRLLVVVMLITFQLTARLVDLRVRRHAGRSVRAYLRAVPETARRPSASDRTSEPVPVAEIGVGDEVRVGADERIPVEGVIVSGQSWVDHSMLTGRRTRNRCLRAMHRLPDALAIAQRARRAMLQNHSWAVVYNMIALPAEVMGYVHQTIAVVAMGASTLCVLGNSSRLALHPGSRDVEPNKRRAPAVKEGLP